MHNNNLGKCHEELMFYKIYQYHSVGLLLYFLSLLTQFYICYSWVVVVYWHTVNRNCFNQNYVTNGLMGNGGILVIKFIGPLLSQILRTNCIWSDIQKKRQFYWLLFTKLTLITFANFLNSYLHLFLCCCSVNIIFLYSFLPIIWICFE